MKVVFLDFDGVLNSKWYFRKAWEELPPPRGDSDYLDPKAVRWLNAIVEPSGAVVVISSTWRLGRSIEALQAMLDARGFRGRVLDATPNQTYRGLTSRIPGAQRGAECRAWLDAHPETTHYVALDDGEDFDAIREHHVLVKPGKGLKPRHVARALELLGVQQAP